MTKCIDNGWKDEEHEKIKTVRDDEVECHMEGFFDIKKRNKSTYEGDPKNITQIELFKTYVIQCGMYDGEQIDLFDLQKWFDDNREWINSLKQECET